MSKPARARAKRARKVSERAERVARRPSPVAAPPAFRRRIGPQPGFQYQVTCSKADVTIMGGAANCGKSTIALLEAARDTHNTPGMGAVFLRRTTPEITNEGGLWDESTKIYPDLGGHPTGGKLQWRWPNGGKLTMRHLEHEDSVLAWQGAQVPLFCCEVGTRIRMADGTLKPVETVRIGDMVATLAGPRMVTTTFLPHLEECVEAIIRSSDGAVVGTQVHAASHGLLTPDGSWASFRDRSDAAFQPSTCGPMESHSVRRFAGRSDTRFLSPSQLRDSLACRLGPQTGSARSQRDRRSGSAIGVCTVLPDLETGSESSQCGNGAHEQPPSVRLPVVLLSRSPDSEAMPSSPEGASDGDACEMASSSRSGSTGRCSSSPRRRDGRGDGSVGIGRAISPRPNDAERQIQTDSPLDGQGTVQTHSPHRSRYAHPYTGEARTTVELTTIAACEMTPCGVRSVVHLSVEGEAHYITEFGLINRNCFDELTHFTAKQFWYLFSRNRSNVIKMVREPDGRMVRKRVRARIIASCNPDADSWVADLIAWWIDQEPKRLNPETGVEEVNPGYGFPIKARSGVLRYFTRVQEQLVWGDTKEEVMAQAPGTEAIDIRSLTFIPGKLTDNKLGDPRYRGQLMAMSRVERGRLLDGNWKIRAIAGECYKREEVRMLRDAPPESDLVNIVRRWDLAATEPSAANKDPDWTIGVKMAKRRSNGKIVVLHVERLRKRSDEVRRTVRRTAELDGDHVRVVIPQDPGQAGVDQLSSYVALLEGYTVGGDRETGDKYTRQEPFSAQWQHGNVEVVEGPWNAAFFDILEAFPTKGVHDDDVDAGAGAYREVIRGRTASMFD